MHVVIDCSAAADTQALHALIARALQFPHWYGHNLDALLDCLTDLKDTTVTLTGRQGLPFPAEGFWETFLEAAEENPRLTVHLD